MDRKDENKQDKVSPDVLPPSGGGNEGTDTLVNNYKNDTPGQTIVKFKDWKKHK